MRTVLIALMGALALPSEPGPAWIPIGDGLWVGAERWELSYRVTREAPEQVARAFVEAWERQGYPVTVEGSRRTALCVSAWDTRAGIHRLVALHRDRGRTVELSVQRPLWGGPQRPPSSGPRTGLLALEVGEAGDVGRYAETAVQVGAADAVRAELLAAWARAGQRVTRQQRSEARGRVEWLIERQEGTRTWMTFLAQVGEGHTAVVSIQRPLLEVRR